MAVRTYNVHRGDRAKVMTVLGTRPEAIKLAPVIRELSCRHRFEVMVVSTGQHSEMALRTLEVFGIAAHFDLGVMVPGQTLSSLTERILNGLDPVLAAEVPHVVLVQGDTTTAFAAALASFHRRIPVGHIEAGLRTHDRYSPFPEEVNRRLVTGLATWHFAPTESGRQALLGEGVGEDAIFVTGNPVIDALQFVLASRPWPSYLRCPEGRLILITAHRRESFGQPLERICRAARRIVEEHPDVEIWYPVHPNPLARGPVERILADHPRIHVVEPLDYVAFCHLLAQAHLVLTDSGGLQEEAPSLGKPVLITRDVTERPEGVAAGVAEIVGTDEDLIVQRVRRLLDDETAYSAMAHVASPYGDGFASARIATHLESCLWGSATEKDSVAPAVLSA